MKENVCQQWKPNQNREKTKRCDVMRLFLVWLHRHLLLLLLLPLPTILLLLLLFTAASTHECIWHATNGVTTLSYCVSLALWLFALIDVNLMKLFSMPDVVLLIVCHHETSFRCSSFYISPSLFLFIFSFFVFSLFFCDNSKHQQFLFVNYYFSLFFQNEYVGIWTNGWM